MRLWSVSIFTWNVTLSMPMVGYSPNEIVANRSDSLSPRISWHVPLVLSGIKKAPSPDRQNETKDRPIQAYTSNQIEASIVRLDVKSWQRQHQTRRHHHVREMRLGELRLKTYHSRVYTPPSKAAPIVGDTVGGPASIVIPAALTAPATPAFILHRQRKWQQMSGLEAQEPIAQFMTQPRGAVRIPHAATRIFQERIYALDSYQTGETGFLTIQSDCWDGSTYTDERIE